MTVLGSPSDGKGGSVKSAKSFAQEAALLEAAMQECDTGAYNPSDWCVGIGHDVERNQFKRPGLDGNLLKTCLQLPDEQTARGLHDYLRGLGLNGDAHGDDADHPPTQVYVYRHPRLAEVARSG
jgi:hypothetical protein